MDALKQSNGEKTATFVVRVSQKNGSAWYGNVMLADRHCQKKFASVQELFEVMSGVLHDSAPEK